MRPLKTPVRSHSAADTPGDPHPARAARPITPGSDNHARDRLGLDLHVQYCDQRADRRRECVADPSSVSLLRH